MATTDKLTGSTSRQVFDMIYDHAARSARRHGTRTTLLAIDIDGFKPINDQHGHAAGDAVLRALGSVFNERLRETDTLCRWGGDEFVALLTDCALDDARRVAEDIRRTVADRAIQHGDRTIHVTVSIGVAQYSEGENLPSLVARADSALYAAKGEGRNTVATA